MNYLSQSSQSVNKIKYEPSKVIYRTLSSKRERQNAYSRNVTSKLSVKDVPSSNKIINRNGSISCNYFRGVHKELLNNYTENVCQSMTVEDLYEEILFEICYNIGCESQISTETLFDFVQDVFKISTEKHEEILGAAQKKDPPSIRLNVEIIKAENLLPKDANGLSDPFVTLYLESNTAHRYNSSVKGGTLNPKWEEHFSLPIADSPTNEILTVEVWDFDAAETVKEKVNKLFDVKGVRGLRKLMKEIAVTASTGKHDNELIGRTSISLKLIPVSGITVWYNLEKGAKAKSRGSILVNLALSAEKNKRVAVQEHRHLLKLLLLHELDVSQVTPFWWSGKFNDRAEVIRSQHSVHSGLTPFECALSNWTVYTSVHEDYPLSLTLFNNILCQIVPVLKCLHWDCEDVQTFWDGVRRVLPSCFAVIRKVRCKNVGDKHIINVLCDVLDIFAILMTLEVPPELDLFPQNLYGWISKDTSNPYDLNQGIIDAIGTGTKEWLDHIAEMKTLTKNTKSTDDSQLQYLIKLIQMVRSDLQRAIEYFDKHFYQKIRISFSSILFKFYDPQLANIVQSSVEDVCDHIERLYVPDDQFEFIPNVENINMGTSLFELYLILKRFLELGKTLCPNDRLVLDGFYVWFTPGVTHWLDISILKALTRIEKAIELDELRVVDEAVKYSSSAIDTLAIFYQIKIFWQQLDWPDVEGSYTFLAKIIDDICRCCVFYAQKMSRRVGNGSDTNDELFNVSLDSCIAINNIDYIRQSLPSFIKELRADQIIEKLGEFRSNLEADRCSSTIKNVIDNALDTQRNQILELIEIVAKKMAPPIKKYLAEGAEVIHENSNSMEKLMLYMENSLKTLCEALNEINFQRILDAIWSELSVIMYDLIHHNLDKRRPPAFFQNLRETLHTMVSCFKIGQFEGSDTQVLAEIEKLLDLHSLETADLIHQYYIHKLQQQHKISKSDYGQLTIKANFTTSSLKLTVMNARNLVPIEKNGSCDPFVKACFLPSQRFSCVSSVKTASQNKTCFPLYDEEFIINLSDEQLSYHDSIILFSIKDKDMFGMTSRHIAECCISFADIKNNENEQIHMTLTKPNCEESEITEALEQRQGDKQARDFLKKLKSKNVQ